MISSSNQEPGFRPTFFFVTANAPGGNQGRRGGLNAWSVTISGGVFSGIHSGCQAMFEPSDFLNAPAVTRLAR